MATKKLEIVITKYYLIAWIYGLLALACVYKGWWIIGIILLFFFFSFSVLDITNPPPVNTGGDGPKAA